MEVQALSKYVRVSPKKVIEVTRVIQGRPAAEALDLLRFIPRKTARLVRKTLASAVANAENNHNLSSAQLVVKYAFAEQGPVIKRFQPVSRGSAHSIHKTTTHIRIILSDNAPAPAAAAAE
ncbi:MAG: 50S ribosomal protein L22 [Opitutales bacterium]|jgi:large subunit ribosomal protein L22